MRKILTLIFLVCLFPLIAFAQQGQIPIAPDTQDQTTWYPFNGQWMPAVDPALIGPKNYKTLKNLRYIDEGLEGVAGYDNISTSGETTYIKGRSGFHFKKDKPVESHVLVQVYNTGLTASQIIDNETAIPSQGNFNASALHTDASGAGLGRFAQGPQGTVLYCNGKESMVWGGDEFPVAAFISSSAAITNTLTNPRDYTEAVRNTLTDTQNIATIGGGIDAYTILMLHADGTSGTTNFTDSSATAHTVTPNGDVYHNTGQFKFGTASAYFDGTGDYLSVPDDDGGSDYWQLTSGTTVFTVDFWARWDGASTGFFEQRDDADNQVLMGYDFASTTVYFYIYDTAVQTVDISAVYPLSGGIWYHFAIIRGWDGNANDWALCVNGTAIATGTDADLWPDLAGALNIGQNYGGTVLHTGWIDEFRVSKGVARWISDFTVPSRAYSAGSLYWVVGSTRALQGVKYYIQNANTETGTITVSEWNGASWTALTATDNTSGLSATGTVTWASTVSTSKPRYLGGYYLYFYRFVLSAGNADIYYATVDAPWQNIRDIWDGVYRQPIQFQVDRAGVMEDYTLEVNQGSNVEYPIAALLGDLTNTDEIYIMFDERMSAIKFSMIAGKTNTAAVTLSLYYWDGSAWVAVSNLTDLTLDSGGTKTLSQTGVVSWTAPDVESEFPRDLYGLTGYAYKIVPSGALTAGTEHDGTSVDLITGIPAPQTVRPFKFPALYKSRALLCGFTESSEGNRCDYSSSNAPNTYNGADSSMNGLQSLYFGGEEELSAATQLYNRFGSNIFATLLVLKDSETYLLTGDYPGEGTDTFRIFPISFNVGCPAPLTLATAELGYEVAEDAQRNVAFWLSYSGPVMFDGAVMIPLKGVENFFDSRQSECINTDAIENARGWYDQANKEYNILIPSGSGQTTNNKWLVYSLKYKKWFEKNPGSADYPQIGFSVQDIYGTKYTYGMIDTGYLMRLEYGTNWNDREVMVHEVETGDFYPSNNIWDKTRIRRVKLAAKKINDAHSAYITHYPDTEVFDGSYVGFLDTSTHGWLDTGTHGWADAALATLDLSLVGGPVRVVRVTEPSNLLGWSHRLHFEVRTEDTTKGFVPVMYGVQWRYERLDQ